MNKPNVAELDQLLKLQQKIESVKVSLASTAKFGDISTEARLGEVLEQLRSDVLAGHQADAQRGDTFARFATTCHALFEAHEATNVEQARQLAEMAAVAQEANDIAKSFARNGGGQSDSKWGVTQALRALPWESYKPDKDAKMRQAVDPYQYGLLSMPDGEMKRMLPDSDYKAVRLWREYGDMIAILNALSLSRGGQSTQDYIRRGGWESLSFAEPYKALTKVLQTAGGMSTGEAGEGAEWVPTGWTSTLFEDVRASLQVVAQIQQLAMPTNPYHAPVLGSPATVMIHAEQTAPTGQTLIGPSNVETVNILLNAVMHSALTVISRQFDQDSIVPAMPMIRRDFAYAHQYGLEDAYVNSQGAGAIDTPAPTGGNVQLSFPNGIRRAANLITDAHFDQAGTPDVATIVPIIAKMGKYAKIGECFFATSYHGWARLLLLKDGTNSLVLTKEKVGNSDVLATGVVGTLLGYPIVVSDAWPQTMDTAGLVDGAALSNTSIALVNKRMFVGGMRMAMEIDASEHVYFAANQIALRSALRPALTTLRAPSNTHPFVGLGVNVACFT